MFSHLAAVAESTAYKWSSSSITPHHPKLVSNNRPTDSSVNSLSPLLDGRSSMTPSQDFPGSWVSHGELETLLETIDPRDRGYNRPTSVLTVNSSSTNTASLLTSPGISQQDEDTDSNLAFQPLALSSDQPEPSLQGGSRLPKRSISGPHPILRSHSLTENYSRPRVAPPPPNPTRSSFNYDLWRPQPRLPEKQRQLPSESSQRRPSREQHSSRVFQQEKQHQPNSRPQIAPAKQGFPRKLHLLASSASHISSARTLFEPHPQAAPRDPRHRSHTMLNESVPLRAMKMQKSNSSIRSSSGLRRPEAVPHPSNTSGPTIHGLHSTFPSQPHDRSSKSETLTENLQSALRGSQPDASEEASTTSLSSVISEPSRLTLKAFLESKPSLQSLIESNQQKQRVRPDSISSNPHRLSTHHQVPHKRKSIVTAGDSEIRPFAAVDKPLPDSVGSIPQSLIQSNQQKQQSRPDSILSNPHRLSTYHQMPHKRKSTVTAGDGEKVSATHTLIRKESREELIKCLEHLIGYDELRYLVSVDKLLPDSIDSTPEGVNTGQSTQDSSHLKRKSIGNGLLGRFSWKQKKTLIPEPSVKTKQRNEWNNGDRRATFGFWGASSHSSRAKVFGCPLEDSDPFCCVTVIGGQKHMIPIVMFYLIEEIYVRGMETAGLMRIAGKAERIDTLVEDFERPPFYGDGIDLASEDIHVLCSLFKRYLRSLPEPLMSRDMFHVLWTHCIRQRKGRSRDLQNQVATAQCLIRLMPARSFSLLIYVVAFLAQIPLSPRNKFNSTGIAKIFGPALLGPRSQRNAALDERPIQALKWMLENWNMITEGLLDEYCVPKVTGSTRPISQSSLGQSISVRRSSQPSLPRDSQDASVLRKDVMSSNSRPSLVSSTTEPSISTASSMTFAPPKSLRSYAPSPRRDSLRSAQYIVDRYEAHEKTVIEGQSVNRGVDGAELRNAEDATVIPASKATPTGLDLQTPQIDGLGGLKDAIFTTSAQCHQEMPQVNQSKDDNFQRNSLSRSFKQQLLVLNEPLDPPPVCAKHNDIELDVVSTANSGITHKSVGLGGNASTQSVQSSSGANSSSQLLRLSEIFSLEKLSLNVKADPNFDEDRAKRIVQKSIEIVDKHQQLLLELKEQLYSMLTQDSKSIRPSSAY